MVIKVSFYVYLVLCRDGSFYCGYTGDPKRRLIEHSSGKGARYTARKGVKEMRIIKQFSDISSAMRFEKLVKKKRKSEKRIMFESGIKIVI